ncbi:hypothetical protein HHI36_015090 [Cryptolaemus montrouzieri]|uniref:Uncharacterized protein n=1 Tax=Cryptolaemus montrouzieri TaxID=559131 RepID=A0ABD2N4K9_9CUCU
MSYSESSPPEFIKAAKRCSRKDQACFKEAIQDALPKFAKGYRSMGIPALDPLLIPLLEIPSGSGAVKMNQKFTNGQLIGLSSAKIEELNFDVESKKFYWKFRCPKLILKANYEMTGQIMVFPVKGKGTMETVMEDIVGEEHVGLAIEMKENKPHLKLDGTSLKLDVSKVTYRFDNLFDGNKELGDQINQVMNDNWKAVFDEIKYSYNSGIQKLVDNIFTKLFEQVPLDEVIID